MEDQGKRLLLAVAIVAGMWAIYVTFFAPKPKPAAPVAAQPAAPAAAPGAPAAPGTPGAPAAAAAPTVSKCDPEAAGAITIGNDKVHAKISGCGGALRSWRLLENQYARKDEHGKTIEPGNLVFAKDQPQYFPLQLTTEAGSTVQIDPGARWKLDLVGTTGVVATLDTPELQVTKTYTLEPKGYVLNLAVEVKNKTDKEISEALGLSYVGYQDPNAKKPGIMTYAEPHYMASCDVAGKVEEAEMVSLPAEPPLTRTGQIKWSGIDHKFFMMALAPLDADPVTCTARRFAEPEAAGFMTAGLSTPALKIGSGASVKRSFVAYIGPKHLDRLQAVNDLVKRPVGFEESVKLGWFGFLAKPMLWLLKQFYSWVGNWGIAIIMLTIVVKLLTLYWTTKSMRSMRAMAKLKPKMDELKTKYGDDKQRMNVEMMNLYKTHKVNPLGGCLPMLLQMPVWFALYAALGAAAELYQAPFVGWLQDLTRPDPYHIMPVAVAALMFVQQLISPTQIDSSQQKIMMYAMPLMFGFFSLVFPAGLTVYIFTNTLLTFFHQMYMNKTDPDYVAKRKGLSPAKAG